MTQTPSGRAEWTSRRGFQFLTALQRPVKRSDFCWGSVWLVRLVLAAVLILAGAAKLVNPEALVPTMKANLVPSQLIPVATVLIASVEILVAGWLVVARSGARPLLSAAVLFGIFALQLAYLLSQNVQSCNCLSGLIQYESSKETMRFQILVNLGVAALCGSLGFWNPSMAKGAADETPRVHPA